MAKDDGTLNWGVERRLEFIEFRLFWEGHVNRGGLINKFGILVEREGFEPSVLIKVHTLSKRAH